MRISDWSSDVCSSDLFASLHGHPASEYPYFLGYEDETGAGAGDGFNHNYPLPAGTDWSAFGPALADAALRLGAYGPDALVISLGVDTYEKDRKSTRLNSSH